MTFTPTERDGVPWADEIVRHDGVGVDDAVAALLQAIPDCFASTSDEDLVHGLIGAGATLVRHAHVMRSRRPFAPSPPEPEFRPFGPDALPPVPWDEALPSFLAAYPASHPDHLPGGSSLIADYLVPYTAGGRLGPLIAEASAIAMRDGHAYAGIIVVDRPGEGAWVCDLWRDPHADYAGAGGRLLGWSMNRLGDHDHLGLVVTVSNDTAIRAYEHVGFAIESTSWTLRLPASSRFRPNSGIQRGKLT